MSLHGLTGGGPGGGTGGGAPSGAAGGDLSGTYPDPSVVNDGHSHTAATLPPLGVTDHGALTGLSDDDHAQYAALAGRSGGTVLDGSPVAGEGMVLRSNGANDAGSVTIQLQSGDALAVFRGGAIELRRDIYGFTSNRALVFMTIASSATQPVFCPNDIDYTTGIGRAGAGQLSLIANGIEIARLSASVAGVSDGMRALRCVEANTAGSGTPNVLTVPESRVLFTNEGAGAENYHALPAAAAGLEFQFYCQDADGIRIVAGAGDTIRIAGSASAAAGFVRSLAVGSALVLSCINATEWVATSAVGTWTVDI